MSRWQVLAGPAAAPPVADLTKAASRKVTFRLSEPSELSFTMPGRHEQTGYVQELATDVHLLRAGDVLYTGRVGGTSDDIGDDQHTVAVSTADTRALLGRRLWPDEADAAGDDTATHYDGDTGALARLLVETAQEGDGADLGVDTSAVADTGTSIVRDIEGGAPVNAELDTAAAVGRPDDGFDWDITPGWQDRVLRLWTPRRGTDRNVVLDYTWTGGPRSSIVAKLSRQVDPADYANSVTVVGGVRVEQEQVDTAPSEGEGKWYEIRYPTHPVTLSNVPPADAGRWEKRIVDDELVWQDEVQARAEAELARLETVQPSYSITLKDGAWDGPEHIWLGDTVHVRLRSGRLDEQLELRVTELAVELGDSGQETVTLTVGPPRATLLSKIHDIERRLR